MYGVSSTDFALTAVQDRVLLNLLVESFRPPHPATGRDDVVGRPVPCLWCHGFSVLDSFSGPFVSTGSQLTRDSIVLVLRVDSFSRLFQSPPNSHLELAMNLDPGAIANNSSCYNVRFLLGTGGDMQSPVTVSSVSYKERSLRNRCRSSQYYVPVCVYARRADLQNMILEGTFVASMCVLETQRARIVIGHSPQICNSPS